MWGFELTWVGENGNTLTDTGRASGKEIDEWVEAISRAHQTRSLTAEVKIPTDGDGDWSEGVVPALRVKRIKVIGGPDHTW